MVSSFSRPASSSQVTKAILDHVRFANYVAVVCLGLVRIQLSIRSECTAACKLAVPYLQGLPVCSMAYHLERFEHQVQGQEVIIHGDCNMSIFESTLSSSQHLFVLGKILRKSLPFSILPLQSILPFRAVLSPDESHTVEHSDNHEVSQSWPV